MGFVNSFEKAAEIKKALHSSPWSKEEQSGPYSLRYHPLRRRWSCSCGDFKHRREKAPDDSPIEDKYCKHIRAHLFSDSVHHIRALDKATGYKFPKDKYSYKSEGKA